MDCQKILNLMRKLHYAQFSQCLREIELYFFAHCDTWKIFKFRSLLSLALEHIDRISITIMQKMDNYQQIYMGIELYWGNRIVFVCILLPIYAFNGTYRGNEALNFL